MRPPHPDRKKRRQQAYQRGQGAERFCRWYLRFKGYRIVARNWRCPRGEIDIIARRGNILAFIEVKARLDPMIAGEAVKTVSQKRVSQAARMFLATHPKLGNLAPRFDAMMVTPRSLPIHYKNAWQLNE